MYQPLLTRKYLTSKIMPLLSAAAVMLCTAMVLIVWSVMGGFLNMLLDQGRTLIGDVVIQRPIDGISYYDELIDELEALPEVEAASPTIETQGILSLGDNETRLVSIVGIDPDAHHRVTNWRDTLYWRPIDEPLAGDDEQLDYRLNDWIDRLVPLGERLEWYDPAADEIEPAAVTGLSVSRWYVRERAGYFRPAVGFLPGTEVSISVPRINRRGGVSGTESARLTVANEFQTGLYEVDANQVFVPLEVVQELTGLASYAAPDPDFVPGRIERGPDGEPRLATPGTARTEPARATSINLRATPGVTPDELLAIARSAYLDFAREKQNEPSPPPERVLAYTWEGKPGLKTFIAAVKKETALVLFLFALISLVAVVLILSIFWAMVSEKTKDIGVLRAIGASRGGICWLFLRYGLAIGVVGAAAGGLLAWLVVANINPIHDWLGEALGLVVWDPSIYYFSTIPSDLEPGKAAIVVGAAIASSVLGALVPALRAARMDPVRALRFE